jgi:predicted enzyme related to lactoylglutathione lyase
MERSDLPFPLDAMSIIHLVVAEDVVKTTAFYEKLGGKKVYRNLIKLANTWVAVVPGGQGTPDKPDVTMGPPTDPDRVDAFMTIKVADIRSVYEEWSSKGIEFITPPLNNQGYEIRCYARDPDGRVIEVAQITDKGLQYFLDFEPD